MEDWSTFGQKAFTYLDLPLARDLELPSRDEVPAKEKLENPAEFLYAPWSKDAVSPVRSAAQYDPLLQPAAAFQVNSTSINSFASKHTGGGQFLNADGFARFIGENADATILSRM